MVSIEKIQKEMEGIYSKKYTGTPSAEKKERKRDEKRLSFLKSAIAFIESNPRPEFLEAQLKKCEAALTLYKRMIVVRMAKGNSDAAKQARRQLNAEFNPNALRYQISFIEFLLFA